MSTTMLVVEGRTQAALRHEKSLNGSRISSVLHTKASPKAGKAAAGEGGDPSPTSSLVHPPAWEHGGKQQAAPALATSACSMTHSLGVTRRNSTWYRLGHLSACQACSVKQTVKHR